MPQTDAKYRKANADSNTVSGDLCQPCSRTTVDNDNNQPPTNTVTLTELASAMQLDEDVLLQCLASILRKREDDANVQSVGD